MSLVVKMFDKFNPFNSLGDFIVTSSSTPTADDFFCAAVTGNEKIVTLALQSLDPTVCKPKQAGTIYQLLVDRNIKPPYLSEYKGFNLLVVAGLCNQVGIVELLLKDKNGVKLLNQIDDTGEAPLHYLARAHGFSSVLQLFIAAAPEIDIRSTQERTPLSCATDYRNTKSVELLLNYPKLREQQLRTALDPYLSKDVIGVVVKFCPEFSINKGYLANRTSLYDALNKAYETASEVDFDFLQKSKNDSAREVIKLLLAHGADPRITVDPGSADARTLVEWASRHDLSPEIIKMLETKAKELDEADQKQEAAKKLESEKSSES